LCHGAAEYVGNEDVPTLVTGIPVFQISNRHAGNGKMEIIDIRSGSPIALR
jgi:hypothetical protein